MPVGPLGPVQSKDLPLVAIQDTIQASDGVVTIAALGAITLAEPEGDQVLTDNGGGAGTIDIAKGTKVMRALRALIVFSESEEFTATAGQTDFLLHFAPKLHSCRPFVDGLRRGDFALNDKTLVFDPGLSLGAVLIVDYERPGVIE